MVRSIVATIFLAGALVIFFTWSQPYFYEIRNLKNEKAALNKILADSRQIQQTKNELLSEYNAIPREKIDRLNKFLPASSGSISFILEVEDMAKNSGMILKDIDITGSADEQKKVSFGENKSPFEKIPFRIKVIGSYASFTSFLSGITVNLRLIDVTGVKFSTGDGSKELYEFDVDAVTYWKNI